jgi:two-component system OmpR family sensor kinase/two-component system sensor histidine kinase BaeS
VDRLWIRLTLAFVTVIAITLVTVALLASSGVGRDFQQYLTRRDALVQEGLLDSLLAYYQRNGNWEGVSSVFASEDSGRGQGRGMMRGRPAMLVVDSQGQIVYDSRAERTGTMLTATERNAALPITDGPQVVGYFAMLPGQGGMMPAEQTFLDRLQGTLLTAALIASSVGIVSGLILSRTVAKPLSALANAATRFASKEWSQRVPVQGTAEVRQVAAAFNQMADSLEQADRLRRSLMADIAHELRTPLTVMQGTLHAMIDDVYPLDKAELTTIYDETRLLSRLVDDVRDLALADAGQLQLNLQQIDIKTLIQNAVSTFAIAADAKGLEVIASIPANLPCVDADPDRLSQVLHNLMANALRHTQVGSICISVAAQPDQPEVRVSISDTGDGIPPEELPHVFDRFYRGRSGKIEKGSGLGLPIARTWITAMKGEIGVKSAAGKGSEFWFTLPVQTNPAYRTKSSDKPE